MLRMEVVCLMKKWLYRYRQYVFRVSSGTVRSNDQTGTPLGRHTVLDNHGTMQSPTLVTLPSSPEIFVSQGSTLQSIK